MSEHLWALTKPDGETQFRYLREDEHPAGAHEVDGFKAWQLDRGLKFGEVVEHKTGKIVFDVTSVQDHLVTEIKAKTAQRILDEYPLWKQLNDRDLPVDDPGVVARKARRDALRIQSNDWEARLAKVKSPDALVALRKEWV
jgi:hypothetical protein